jgi:hypothetical protein
MNLTPKQTIKGTVAEAQSLKGTMKDIPSVDNTLTKEGFAADAKAVGYALNTKAPISHTEDKCNPHGVTASQVGARPDTWMPSASEIGARPNTWMPTAQEVGARPDTWMPTAEDVGAATPTEVSNAVKKANPVNLLDNSDFRNPVNQRGNTAKVGKGVYTIDRWLIDSPNGKGYWDLKPNTGSGLNVNGEEWMVFVQRVAGLDRTKQYTIAFKDGNGNIYINNSADIQWHDNYAEARIILNAGTRTIVWAALYEGEYTAETLPEYHPKGYAHELAECKRYFEKINWFSMIQAVESYYIPCTTWVEKRIVPTITVGNVCNIYSTIFTPQLLEMSASTNSARYMRFDTDMGYDITLMDVEISADL